jgi:hypothetical protein
MSGYGSKEARINQERRVRVNLCGDCGQEISETELLCETCRRTGENLWEPLAVKGAD